MAESLAVKYRPTRISTVLGQEHTKEQLQAIFENPEKRPGAILLCGPSGVGKTTFSRIICSTLNCQNQKHVRKTWDPCGECESCQIFALDSDTHPDFEETNAADSRGIDDVRRLIKLAELNPRYNTRIILLDECHQLTSQAMQTLLKDLEEPSQNTLWIMATTDPQKLPDTAFDRCLKLTLRAVKKEEIAGRLVQIAQREGQKIKLKDTLRIADYAGSSVRASISMLESCLLKMSQKTNKNKKFKAILDDAYFEVEGEDGVEAAMTMLVGFYEEDRGTMLASLAGVTDMFRFAQKLDWHNTFILYQLLNLAAKNKVKNPSPFTPDNRQLWAAILPDVKDDKKKIAKYLARGVKFTAAIKNLRQEITTVAGTSALSLAICNLLDN